MKKKIISAQAQLLQRASILMAAGEQELVFTNCSPALEIFSFAFGDIVLEFDADKPFDELEIDRAITALDTMIEDVHRKAEHAITLINAWRG